MALVVGVVLAVVNVPVGAVVAQWSPGSSPPFGMREYALVEGSLVMVRRAEAPTGTWWQCIVIPREDERLMDLVVGASDTREVDHDPRPSLLRSLPVNAFSLEGVFRAGWPFEGAAWRRSEGPNDPRPITRGAWEFMAFGRMWTIPLIPHWPGLLANMVFYAMVVLAPVVLWRWLRVRRRAKRKQCLACGYELGAGVDVCPECGPAGA